MRRRGGFTLVELMAVAVLVALVSGLGIMSYAKSYKKWSIEQEAKSFYLTAKYGRVYAIEHQEMCRLVIDQEQRRYFLVRGDEEEGFAGDEQEEGQTEMIRDSLSKPVVLADHVRFEGVQKIVAGGDGDSGAILFSPNGTAENVRVQIGDGTTSYTVSISGATGRAKVFEGVIADAASDQIDLDLNE